jgi:chromosomal replication initiator protein
VTTSEHEVVAALRQGIADRIGEPRFLLWFDKNTKFTWTDDLLSVGVPNHFYQEWLQNTFLEAVRAAASEALERPMQVRFVIDPELFRAARKEQEAGREPRVETRQPAADEPKPKAPPEERTPKPEARGSAVKRTRHWRRLCDFVVGACNRVAHASALSVVEEPGQGGNPLVLHGPVGTGKTHLLEGIYVGLRQRHPQWRVVFITSEDFTNRFVQAMRLSKLGAFRHHFRECDALLMDDLQFLATKKATQEEFLHTFDALQSAGRQMVVTCDGHPKLAEELTPELTDRLLGGAVWGLTPPDADTRRHLLRSKASRNEMRVPDDVLELLAEQLHGNVRELEGALHSIRHYSRVAGRPIDLSLAREALGDLLRHSVRVLQLDDVDRAVCRALRLDNGALQSRQRAWAVSHPRMVAMFLARKHTAAAYSEIGQHFGGRNHSTAVAAEKKVRQWLQEDGELALGERRLRAREVVALVERELLR